MMYRTLQDYLIILLPTMYSSFPFFAPPLSLKHTCTATLIYLKINMAIYLSSTLEKTE